MVLAMHMSQLQCDMSHEQINICRLLLDLIHILET